MQKIDYYLSERNEFLVSRVDGVITCENYCKWYDLYYIMTDEEYNNMKKQNPLYTGNKIIKLSKYLQASINEIQYLDHSWEPKSLVEFATKYGLKIGSESYKAIVNMYYENYFDDISEHLPKVDELKHILVCDLGDYSNCNFVRYDDTDGKIIPYDEDTTFKYCIPDTRSIF